MSGAKTVGRAQRSAGPGRDERGFVALLLVALIGVVIAGSIGALLVFQGSRSRASRERVALLRAISSVESLVGWQLQGLQDAEANQTDPVTSLTLPWGSITMAPFQENGNAYSVDASATFDAVTRQLRVSLKEPVHSLFRKSIYAGNRHGGTCNLRFGPDRLLTSRYFRADHAYFDGAGAGVPNNAYVDAVAAQVPEDYHIHRNHEDGVYPFAYRGRQTYGNDTDWTDARIPPFDDIVANGTRVWEVALGSSGEDLDGDGIDDGEDDGFTYGSYSVGNEQDARDENYMAEWNAEAGPDPARRYYIDIMPMENRAYVWDIERYWVGASTSQGNEGTDGSVRDARVGSRRGERLLAVYEYPAGLFGEVDQEYVVRNRDEVAGSVFVNRGEDQDSDAITVGTVVSDYPYRDPALLAAYRYNDVVEDNPLELPTEIASEGAIGTAQYSWSDPYSTRVGDTVADDLSLDSEATVKSGAERIEPPDLSEIDYAAIADVIVSPPVAGSGVYLEDGATYNSAIEVTSDIEGISTSTLFVKPVDFMADPMADIPRFVKDADGNYDAASHDNYFFTLGSYAEAFPKPSNSYESYLAWSEVPADMRLKGTKYNRMLVPTSLHRKLVYVDGNLVVEPDGARVIMDAMGSVEYEGQVYTYPWWNQPAEVTVVVKGNIYLADAIMASSEKVGLVLIALEDDGGSYEDLNSNGKRDEGEPLTPGSTSPPAEGSGNIFFGDTNADDPIGASTAYLFAENDFHVLPPTNLNRQQTFGVIGNMTAGNKIHFGGRGRSNLFVQNDVRMLRGMLDPKGLPKGFSYSVTSWVWLSQVDGIE